MLRLGALVSGTGSNLQALIDACAERRIHAEVAVVLSNIPGARGLERARKAGIPAVALDHHAYPNREAFDAAAVQQLRAHGVELVCLAGFMRLVSPVLLAAFPDRVINIHPGLLPAFPGLHAPRQALQRGVRIAGCTVHFVDGGVDTGPILVQAAVPVLPGDDEESLAARILEQEHRIYPQAIELIARGRAMLRDGKVELREVPDTVPGPLVYPPIK